MFNAVLSERKTVYERKIRVAALNFTCVFGNIILSPSKYSLLVTYSVCV